MTTTAPGPGFLTANEAVAFLSVKRATLYTYVSRGLLRSVPCPGGRGRYYLREDVERLKARSEAHAGRSGPDSDVERSSSRTFITQMSPEGPRYRGHAVADLVREGNSFEAVAELLMVREAPLEGGSRLGVALVRRGAARRPFNPAPGLRCARAPLLAFGTPRRGAPGYPLLGATPAR
ncbi:helix-turn-helix domain-containing protein [Polyangium jinanense]|uniref:Citrate synthase n=1 Tax=Polyangium jinanense TaxID=2829994 RepID=A0A9X4AS97_9BACT|nr:citrate synthase [Polyangium jinanense]MDC3982928.1 citrate synthase [Polyangium jinanense]